MDDSDVLAYVRQDNYTPLRAALAALPQKRYPGWRPDLDYAAGFDVQGFANDGSEWRAFRFKPFPGTFWPSNGSSNDALIRLPPAFRQDAQGRPSRAIYRLNLSILEAAVGSPDSIDAAAIVRTIEPVDERIAGLDLDRDGRLSASVTHLRGLPRHYAGAARSVEVRRWRYPTETEFLHSVRYLDPDAPDQRAARLKELRYSIKSGRLDEAEIELAYAEEAEKGLIGALPHFLGSPLTGLTNDFGWTYQAFIEGADGRLRLQTHEEHWSCMGCHSGLGVTVDGSFAFPRKLPGAAGWGHQSLAGIVDVPQSGHREPETLEYLQRAGAGDEFRANQELLARLFPRGLLDQRLVRRSAPGGDRDLQALLNPSRNRALALNKAYRLVVLEQSFERGRDAVLAPMQEVWRRIEEPDTGLVRAGRIYRDAHLWLDWSPAAVVIEAPPR
jgi:hypothetical protein